MHNSRPEARSTMSYHHTIHNTWFLDLMFLDVLMSIFMVASLNLVQTINREILQAEVLDPSCGHQTENDN